MSQQRLLCAESSETPDMTHNRQARLRWPLDVSLATYSDRPVSKRVALSEATTRLASGLTCSGLLTMRAHRQRAMTKSSKS